MALDPEYLNRFKGDLMALTPAEVFGRYIAPDPCYGLSGVDERSLRERIAAHFGIGIAGIKIVGSAKLGFTLRHKSGRDGEPDRPMFSPFADTSDVDIAIISDAIFDTVWKRCFEFWQNSGYDDGYWRSGRDFRNYFFRGWMRPDKLPSEGSFTYKRDWFDFFRRLTNDRAAGDYKITAGLYREGYFLESYQHIALSECRNRMRANP